MFKKIKKYFSFVSLMTIAISVHADQKLNNPSVVDNETEVQVFNENTLDGGFYLGFGLGYDAFRVRQNVTLDNNQLVTLNPILSAKGPNVSFFGGYGQYFGCFYYAGELLVEISTANSSFSLGFPANTYHSNISMRSSYGGAFLPGLRLNDTSLIYARLGFLRTALKTSEFAHLDQNLLSGSDIQWKNGLNLGLGMEMMATPSFSLRGEYSYTHYNAFTSPLNTNFLTSNNQFVLSLIYHFC